MKYIFLLLLIASLFLQNPKGYWVINEDSKAWSKLKNKKLSRGDFLDANDEVFFPDNKGILKLANVAGVFYLINEQNKNAANKQTQVLVSSAYPIRPSWKDASRADPITDESLMISYFKQFAEDSGPLVIIDSLLIKVSNKFPRYDPYATYRIEYIYREKTYSDQIKWVSKDNIVYLKIASPFIKIPQEEILKVNLISIGSQVSASKHLCSFYISFQEGRFLIPELKMVLYAVKRDKKSKPQQSDIKILKDYLNYFYGSPDDYDFKQRVLPVILK